MPITSNKKARIKDRDGNKCLICNSREQLTIDHIIPLSEGGTNDDHNLRTLCYPCNIRKANKPPKHIPWFNLLFSRKTIYEFKNEIKGEMSSRDGLVLVETKELIAEQRQQIDELLHAIEQQQSIYKEQLRQAFERIRALQDYHKLEWYEETSKGYKKKATKR